jgi:hypothetical protein
MTTIDATDARLATHEEICAIRYEQINARLKRIEGIMLKTAGIMILSMAGFCRGNSSCRHHYLDCQNLN